MSTFDNAVSIHPYFKIADENMAAAKGFLARFCDLVAKNEQGCLYYNFTFKGNEMFCREAYKDAGAVQAHLANCGQPLGEFLKIAEVLRMEVHGPADQLDVVLDQDPVVDRSDVRRRFHGAVVVKPRRGPNDVVNVPLARWSHRIHLWRCLLVNSPGLAIEIRFVLIGIQDLDLIRIHQENATVAASLS